MTKVDRDTIVVGVDASECSDAAVDWAAAEAKRGNRRLLLVSAWHWSSSMVRSPISFTGQDDPYTASRHILEQAARRARADGVPVHTWLVEGYPASVLPEISADAAMLVMGSHGHGVRKSLLGSVSKGSISQARCPVVIIPSRLAAPDAAPGHRAASAGRRA